MFTAELELTPIWIYEYPDSNSTCMVVMAYTNSNQNSRRYHEKKANNYKQIQCRSKTVYKIPKKIKVKAPSSSFSVLAYKAPRISRHRTIRQFVQNDYLPICSKLQQTEHVASHPQPISRVSHQYIKKPKPTPEKRYLFPLSHLHITRETQERKPQKNEEPPHIKCTCYIVLSNLTASKPCTKRRTRNHAPTK